MEKKKLYQAQMMREQEELEHQIRKHRDDQEKRRIKIIESIFDGEFTNLEKMGGKISKKKTLKIDKMRSSKYEVGENKD